MPGSTVGDPDDTHRHMARSPADGQRVFPNATVHAGKREAGFWLSPAGSDTAPPKFQDFFRGLGGWGERPRQSMRQMGRATAQKRRHRVVSRAPAPDSPRV